MEERIIKDINDLLTQLFQKMHEAGYEWDAEKKELKKIEQKPAWNEEDEDITNKILCICDDFAKSFETSPAATKVIKEDVDKIDNWLESLKERVQPKPQQEWSEEDEIILRTIISDGIRGAEFDMLQINWLKSLKERYTWKPSDEQMKCLSAAIEESNENSVLESLLSDLKKLRKNKL